MGSCGRPLPALLCCLLLLLLSVRGQRGERTQRRFEYKHSFKGPQLVLRDGTVPFWAHHGSALPSSERIRVVPSMRSQSGSVWAKNIFASENWEVEVSFRISGRSGIGADGLAIWYTRESGPTGPVYGAADHWDGVGIFFDSYDNDGRINNPAILIVGNDGQLSYDHSNDGGSQILGSCFRDYRNTYHPVGARIRYYQKTLQIYLNMKVTDFDNNYEFCTEVRDMNLPLSGYFGVSAATGGVADDHDVLSFLVFTLYEPGAMDPAKQISDKEQEEYQKKYEQFEKDLEKRRGEFQKEHPEFHTPDEDLFETESQRELQMVAGGQAMIHRELKDLRERLDTAFEEQKQYVERLSKMGKEQRTTIARGAQAQDGDGPQSLTPVLNGQKQMIQQVQEIRTNIANILSKVRQSQQSLDKTVDKSHASEIKEHIHTVRKDIDNLSNIRVQHVACPKAPPLPSCTSTWQFVMFIVLQSIFFLSYLIHRSKREASYKKFF